MAGAIPAIAAEPARKTEPAATLAERAPPPPRRNGRAILGQAVAVLLVLLVLAWAAHNAAGALARRNIDVDFAFLLRSAGFDIPFHLAPWQTSDSYGRALFVAGLNTL